MGALKLRQCGFGWASEECCLLEFVRSEYARECDGQGAKPGAMWQGTMETDLELLMMSRGLM